MNGKIATGWICEKILKEGECGILNSKNMRCKGCNALRNFRHLENYKRYSLKNKTGSKTIREWSETLNIKENAVRMRVVHN